MLKRVSNAWYRMQFYTDIRGIRDILRYRRIRARYYRDFWEKAASSIGGTLSETAFGILEIQRGERTTFVDQHNVMLDSSLMLRIAGNKAITYDLLQRLGAPVPRHRLTNLANIREAYPLLEVADAVVVKPASGTGGGRGVITGITSPRELLSAAKRAARHSKWLIVEEQIQAENYRLLYLNGRFIDAIRRDPPTVIGDGRSSIQALVKAANREREAANPPLALSPLVIDEEARNWFREKGISLSDVPAAGSLVVVKRAVNQNDRRGNVNVTARVHPDIVGRCGEFVARMGIALAGVDLMCTAIDQPFSPDTCWINEINTTPGLHHHDLIANPEAGTAVPELILDHLLSTGQGSIQVGGITTQ